MGRLQRATLESRRDAFNAVSNNCIIAKRKYKMLSKFWKDPVWSNVIAWSITGILSFVFKGIQPFNPELAIIVGWGTIMMLAIALLLTFLWIFQLWRQPIHWDFSSFLGMNAFDGRDIHVARFQAKGINKSNQNFRKVTGFLESNINGERISILLDSMPPEETNGIPPKGEFWVGALFRDPDASREGIQAEKFLQRFSDFTFVLFLGKKKYKQRFPRKIVEQEIISFWKESNPHPKPSTTTKNT